MRKRVLIATIGCVILVLAGCGLSRNNTGKNEEQSKPEKDTQYTMETESEIATETEVDTETEKDTEIEVSTQTEATISTEVTVNTETKVPEQPKQETPKQETPKEEITTQPEVQTPEVTPQEPEVQEPEIQTPSQPTRGQYLVEGNLIGASLSVGDGMYNITVDTVNGERIMLSELLQEKDLVVLNFWFINCYYCDLEFPYMSEAYANYKDDVEIIALNPYDTLTEIEYYRNTKPLPFKVAQCAPSWAYAFGINGYPTSVYIDRYGIISKIEVGAVTSVNGFTSIFESYID